MLPVQCPDGHDSEPGHRFCATCGLPVTHTGEDEVEGDVTLPSVGVMRCPYCETTTPTSEPYCSKCLKPVNPQLLTDAASSPIKCPFCESMTPSGESHCRTCAKPVSPHAAARLESGPRPRDPGLPGIDYEPRKAVGAPQQKGRTRKIGDAWDSATNFGIKLFTTGLWGLVAVGGLMNGTPLVGLGAILYLGYIWVLGGRWMIY